MPSSASWERLVSRAWSLRGNGYATITRDDDGRVRALRGPSRPDRVLVGVEVLKTGKLKYKITTTAGRRSPCPTAGCRTLVGLLSPDGYLGRSVIGTFRETLGSASVGEIRLGVFREREHPQGAFLIDRCAPLLTACHAGAIRRGESRDARRGA